MHETLFYTLQQNAKFVGGWEISGVAGQWWQSRRNCKRLASSRPPRLGYLISFFKTLTGSQIITYRKILFSSIIQSTIVMVKFNCRGSIKRFWASGEPSLVKKYLTGKLLVDHIWHCLVEVSPLAHVDITTVRPEDWKKVSIRYEHRQGHIQVSACRWLLIVYPILQITNCNSQLEEVNKIFTSFLAGASIEWSA